METITRNVSVSRQPQTVGEKTIVSDNKELSRVRPHDKEQTIQQPATSTATKVERRKRE